MCLDVYGYLKLQMFVGVHGCLWMLFWLVVYGADALAVAAVLPTGTDGEDLEGEICAMELSNVSARGE